MRYLQYLQEEYADLYKEGKYTAEVFVNPSKTEVKALGKIIGKDFDIRFTADVRTKKLFIWDGNQANHDDMIKYLISRNEIKQPKDKDIKFVQLSKDFLNGMASADTTGKLIFNYSDDMIFTSKEKLAAKKANDWSWLQLYFTNLVFIERL